MELIDGMTADDGMVFGPTIEVLPDGLVLEFNAQPAWSNFLTLYLYESSLFGPTIPVDVSVDWGDGIIQYFNTGGTYDHTYAISGTYIVRVYGNSLGYFGTEDAGVIGISTWGNLQIEDLGYSMYYCPDLVYMPNNLPSSVKSLAGAFIGCTIFNDANIATWNTNNVVYMNSAFNQASSFNQDISSWNTSNVGNMRLMFSEAHTFNQNINLWDVSNVTDMSYMFNDSYNFNQPLNSWNMANVTQIDWMFYGANSFNQDIGNWNVSSINNMTSVFSGATSFNQDIGNWDTSYVTNMTNMFDSATSFNQNIGGWDTSNVYFMNSMFANASSFDGNIGSWNVSGTYQMNEMFNGATTFNQNIGNWNTGNVTSMDYMFSNAISFNQNLSNWCVTNIPFEPTAFDVNTPAWAKTGRQPDWGWCPGNPLILEINTSLWPEMSFQFIGNTKVKIDWGDGNSNTVIGPYDPYSPLKSYSTPGIYNVSIIGRANGFRVTSPYGLTKVLDWGKLTGFNSLGSAFISANNLTNVPNYLPANVTNLNVTFDYCINFNDSNVTLWDTSNVSDMSGTFSRATSFNQNIGNWNTGNVTNMLGMFGGESFPPAYTIFNQDISSWNVSNVTNMGFMFSFATAFNQNIGGWNTSNVTSMQSMFEGANTFNQNISSWNTGNVTSMDYMFRNAISFNQNLSNWCVTNIVSEPVNFATGSALTAGNKPVWGTCPP